MYTPSWPLCCLSRGSAVQEGANWEDECLAQGSCLGVGERHKGAVWRGGFSALPDRVGVRALGRSEALPCGKMHCGLVCSLDLSRS